MHEVDEPIRPLNEQSAQPQGVNDLGGILIRIADITSVARKARQKSCQMHIQYMHSPADKQAAKSAMNSQDTNGYLDDSPQLSQTKGPYKVQSIWINFEKKEQRVEWEQTLWEIAIREKSLERKLRDRQSLKRLQKQKYQTPGKHRDQDQQTQEQRILDYRMKKHFEKKQEIYEEFENLLQTIQNEQDLNA